MYVIAIHFMLPTNIFDSMQTESGNDQDVIDFFDILMDGIQETNELDEYLSQAIERLGTILHGGRITRKFTHGSRQWCLITLVFLVRVN